MKTHRTTCTIIPFLFAAKLVSRVLISVFNQIKLTCQHVYSIPNEKVLLMKVITFGPPQKYSLVLNIKLQMRRLQIEVVYD